MYFFRNNLAATLAAIALGTAVWIPQTAVALTAADLTGLVQGDQTLSLEARQFYAEKAHAPIWIGNDARVAALLKALDGAEAHGLPTARYEAAALREALSAGQVGPEAAAAEIFATRIFLRYARDVSSGALEPLEIDKEIAVKPPRRSEHALLDALTRAEPAALFKALVPSHPHYAHLLAEKVRLEAKMTGEDGTVVVPGRMLRAGMSSPNVILLRQRLAQLGYGDLGEDPVFDRELRTVVRNFQRDRKLSADGIVGAGTLRALNGDSAQDQLQKVIVGLERERWLNRERGDRHIVVNIADFSFNMYENGKVAFHSITVVGKGTSDRRTPEFHDEMTHMVVNPTWHVPRSIAGKEYLPMLKRDPSSLARQGLRVIGPSGRAVNTADVDFTKYSSRNFPFAIKQPPGRRNALGLVKFMFPNKYNIYLHDTPSKSLFKREVRTFSHGCIRVARPFEFAHALLSKQTADPEAAFDGFLKTRREQYVNLTTPVPVFLTYKTAFVDDEGKVHYRADIYGRDAKVWRALRDAGVAQPGV
ncbi:MAG: L,D-transpeptidase family protein [Pseudomonadota bacterium]